MKQLQKADSVLYKADTIDQSIKIPRLHIQLLTEKAALYEQLGDYQSAYNFQSKAAFLKDSLDNSWEKVKYAEISTLYQMKLQEQRNVVLEKSLSINKLQIRQQRFVIIISIGFLLVLSVVAVLFYRKRKFELKTNQMLRTQNE